MNRDDKFSKSQINRQFIDYLGFKEVSVKKFRDRILPNIPFEWEVRGSPYNQSMQKHTKVYRAGDIVDYIWSESERIKREKNKS